MTARRVWLPEALISNVDQAEAVGDGIYTLPGLAGCDPRRKRQH